jgi:hypothetical protein
MEHQLTPPSGREDENVPRLRTGSNSALTGGFDSDLHLSGDLGVRPGESAPGRMLGAVLLLVLATVVLALGLVWWLVWWLV